MFPPDRDTQQQEMEAIVTGREVIALSLVRLSSVPVLVSDSHVQPEEYWAHLSEVARGLRLGPGAQGTDAAHEHPAFERNETEATTYYP